LNASHTNHAYFLSLNLTPEEMIDNSHIKIINAFTSGWKLTQEGAL
jgi:hypothetical protein